MDILFQLWGKKPHPSIRHSKLTENKLGKLKQIHMYKYVYLHMHIFIF